MPVSLMTAAKADAAAAAASVTVPLADGSDGPGFADVPVVSKDTDPEDLADADEPEWVASRLERTAEAAPELDLVESGASAWGPRSSSWSGVGERNWERGVERGVAEGLLRGVELPV